jgi:hypothetical protein
LSFFPATLSALIVEVKRWLEDMPAQDSITSPIAATPVTGTVTIAVNDRTQWPLNGRVEIDDELFFVTSDQTGLTGAGSVTAIRAFASTTAAAHSSGAVALRDVRFTKANIREAINIVVHDWCSHYFPQLVWDTTSAGTFTPIKWFFPAPSDALSVQRVLWQLPGFQKYVDVNHTDLRTYPQADINAAGSNLGTTNALGFEVYDPGMPGRTVKVLYEKRWPYLVADTDTVPIDFPEDAQDLVVQGSAFYLVGWRMMPKFQTAEIIFHREQAAPVPSNINLQMFKLNMEMWQRRAQEIRSRRPVTWPRKAYAGFDVGGG